MAQQTANNGLSLVPNTTVYFWNNCLTKEQHVMYFSDFEKYTQRYFVSFLIVFGVMGNALNLTVLLNRKMRSRANTFLSLLAICDIALLVCVTPNVLAGFEVFYLDYHFRWFYFHTKEHFLALANWASAVAIWSVIAVCADRLIGIRRPLYIRSHVASYKMTLILLFIVVVPFWLTLFRHFEHYCPVDRLCHGTQIYGKCFAVIHETWKSKVFKNTYSNSYRQFIKISIWTNMIFIVMFPIVLLAVLNILLLAALRKRSSEMMLLEDTSNKPGNNHKHHKTEQRVTLTVTLIVTMFTFTNGPSGVASFLDLVSEDGEIPWLFTFRVFTYFLVVLGKASNFIIFCLFSKHFRRRLFGLAQKKVHEKMEARKRSSVHKSSNASRKFTPAARTSSVAHPAIF